MDKGLEFHKKGWGYEKWIVNNSMYCGKILFFEKGKKCSYHYHKIKHETFYLHSGKLQIRYGSFDDTLVSMTKILFPGDKFTIPPLLRHQMVALEDSELFEFSTEHFEDDSYRILKGD